MDEKDQPGEDLKPAPEADESAPQQQLATRANEFQKIAAVVPPEFRALIELEFARIESADKRTALLEKALETQDAQDQREYDFHSNNAARAFEENRGRLSFGRTAFVSSGAIVTLVIAICIWMLFWGDSEQARLASEILKTAFIGVGGFGVIQALRYFVRSLLGSPSRD